MSRSSLSLSSRLMTALNKSVYNYWNEGGTEKRDGCVEKWQKAKRMFPTEFYVCFFTQAKSVRKYICFCIY